MKTQNSIFGTTMILGLMFLTSCQKESIIEPSNTAPTHTSWEESIGAVYQIEIDLDTDLTVIKVNCPNGHASTDSKPNSSDQDCGPTYVATGKVKGYSGSLGQASGNIELTFDQNANEMKGYVTLSFLNTKQQLVLSVNGPINEIGVQVESLETFVGLDFSGHVSIENMLDIFQPNTRMSTSMMLVGELN